jgi:hypothetical protein
MGLVGRLDEPGDRPIVGLRLTGIRRTATMFRRFSRLRTSP